MRADGPSMKNNKLWHNPVLFCNARQGQTTLHTGLFYTRMTVYFLAKFEGRIIKFNFLAQFWAIDDFFCQQFRHFFPFFIDKIQSLFQTRATAKPRCIPAWFFYKNDGLLITKIKYKIH